MIVIVIIILCRNSNSSINLYKIAEATPLIRTFHSIKKRTVQLTRGVSKDIINIPHYYKQKFSKVATENVTITPRIRK